MVRPGVAATPLCEMLGADALLLSPEQDLWLLWEESLFQGRAPMDYMLDRRTTDLVESYRYLRGVVTKAF